MKNLSQHSVGDGAEEVVGGQILKGHTLPKKSEVS